MAAITNQPQGQHWKDTALARAESITDAWEVAKAYAGRLAEWILFLCMIVCIIEILPGVTLWPWLSNTVLGIQAVTLDVGGFALSSMADHARSSGDITSAKRADTTGKFLIGIVILTLTLITVGLLYPPAKEYTDGAEKLLILVRVVMTVVYGHVIHSLRKNSTAQVQPIQVVTLENRLQVLALQMAENQKSLVQQLREEIEAQRQAISQLIREDSEHVVDILVDSLANTVPNTGQEHVANEEEVEIEDRQYCEPLPKITVKLFPLPDKTPNARENNQETKTSPGDGRKRAVRVLKKYPQIGPTELAQKAQISKSYAASLLAELKGK